jgi:hypothetical protein
MKAWRLEASKINARRKAGSNEPSARVQKVLRGKQPVILGSTWLLDGLLIRVGIVDPLPNLERSYAKRLMQRPKTGWRANLAAFVKKLFS